MKKKKKEKEKKKKERKRESLNQLPNNTYLCWLQHFETRKLVPAQFVQPRVFERIFNWRSWPQILGGWQITLSVKAFADFNILLWRFGGCVRDIKNKNMGC